MPVLDHSAARDLVLRVVEELYSKRNSPVPGAVVKSQMLVDAQASGNEFSERSLGFHKFIDFVRAVPQIAIQERSGSDILLVPNRAADLLAAFATPLPRLRRDFWRAFIEFPVASVTRLYDPAEDKIVYVQTGAQRQGIVVEPIAKTTQLEWRKTFAEEQPDPTKQNLLAALNAGDASMFNEFSRRLRENPLVMRTWNRYLQKQITDHVAAWAAKHGIADERWLASMRAIPFIHSDGEVISAKPQNVSQRGELYNFFDQLPIEDLLQLRVPLEWVLKATRRGSVEG